MQGQEPPQNAPDTVEDDAPQAAESAASDDLERDLQTALAKANEHYELYLRARAEGENIRRRAADEVSKAHKFAVESFAESLLPVVDSLEKAIEAARASDASDAMREGLELTLKQLKAAFDRALLKEIDPAGQKFDPHFHQAISMVAADGVAANHVAEVLQKGWMIADRVLRPALVTVSQG